METLSAVPLVMEPVSECMPLRSLNGEHRMGDHWHVVLAAGRRNYWCKGSRDEAKAWVAHLEDTLNVEAV
jgi:hypothetical protein